MFEERIMDVVGYMDFRGERLSYWDRLVGGHRPANVRLTWTQQFGEARSFFHDMMDLPATRFPTASTVSLSTRQVTAWPSGTPVWGPQPWEAFTFTYLSDRGWITTSAACAVVNADATYGTEWRVRPSDYMEDGLTFRKAVMTGV